MVVFFKDQNEHFAKEKGQDFLKRLQYVYFLENTYDKDKVPKVTRIYVWRLMANFGKFEHGAAKLKENIDSLVQLIMTVFKYPNFDSDANLANAVALTMNNVFVQEVIYFQIKTLGQRAH
jgi:hypothetical protein